MKTNIASAWSRLFANFIDGIVLFPIGFIYEHYIIGTSHPGINYFYYLLGNQIVWLYYVFFHWKTGQTLGKFLMTIRVVTYIDESNLKFRSSFIRELPVFAVLVIDSIAWTFYFFSVYLGFEEQKTYSLYRMTFEVTRWVTFFWFVLEMITMLLNKERRAIHDFMAKSKVVKRFW